MKIRPDQFEAMRTPPWEHRRALRDTLEAMGHLPSLDPLSGDLLFKYDATGETRVRFGDDGYVRTIEEPGGRITRAESDACGRLVALITPRGATTRLRWDDGGHVVGVDNPDGSSQGIVYRDGKPVEIWRSGRSSVGIAMSESGQVAALRDGRGAALRFGYNEQGGVNRIAERGGGVTTFAHTPDGQLEELRTPSGGVWRFETDPIGVKTTVRPDGSREVLVAAPGAKAQTYILADGAQIALEVDDKGLPVAVAYPEGPNVNLAWSAPERPTVADNGVHRARFEYDAAGRRTIDEVDGARVAVTYEAGGAVTGIVLPSGEKLAFVPGPDGRIDEVRDWAGNAYRIEWSPTGTVAGLTYPSRLRERTSVLPSGQLQGQDIESSSTRIIRRYTYDENDLVARVDDSVRGAKQHLFDSDDRLVGVSSSSGAVTYSWDNEGNMVAGNGRVFTYDSLNRITGGTNIRCRCDARGNLAEWEDGKGRTTFHYNGQNQLVRADLPGARVIEYEYDALGRRIVKRIGGFTTRFVWLGEQLLSEVTEGPSPSRTDYLYLPGTLRPLAMRRDGQIYFYQVDHLDTPIRLFDFAGNVVWEAEPFGTEIHVLSARVRQPLRFPGQYFDDETGLHYNVARYYQPATGRFITADPPFYNGDSNPYSYARNNPANFVDPSGRNPLLAAVGIAVAAGGLIGAGVAAAHTVASNWANDRPLTTGLGEAVVKGAITGAAGGLGAVAGGLLGALGGPVGAVAGAIIGGFIGAGAAGAGIAAYEAPEGKGWEACKEAAIGGIPFVGSIKKYVEHPSDPHRGAQLAVDLTFDVIGIALIVVGAKKGYSAAKAAEAARETGMSPMDGVRQQQYAKKEGQLVIDRASNEASRQYDGKPGYRPKPHDVETLKTAKEGENAGLVVEPENPTPKQQAEIARLKEEGWSFDEKGRLVDPEGNKIHGDYDHQGVYEVTTDADGNKKYEPVDTNDPKFRDQYNKKVTPGRKMVQHGANDDYVVVDANGNEVMGRQPSPNEVYKVTDSKGNVEVIKSTAELQKFYEDNGIEWPYDNYR